jgi:formamidopyrimidine-DNA glycosylase
MPEGDSVWRVAHRLASALVGRTVAASDFRVPQLATVDLAGRQVLAVTSRGKHLLTRFDGGRLDRGRLARSALDGARLDPRRLDAVPLTLHTHLGMDGAWRLVGPGRVLARAFDDEVRVVLRTDGPTAYALRMPVVELLPTEQENRVVGHLGPDLLGEDWDEDEAVRRLSADPDRPLVEALLDQRNLAGIGNLWAVETCFLRGCSPWTPVRDADLPATVRLARRMMRYSLGSARQVTTGDTRRGATHWVYGRAERPCRRCGTPVQFRDAVEGRPYARETWWCPVCQPGPYPSTAERPTRPGLRRGVDEESFGSQGRRLRGEPGYARGRRPR